MAGTEKRKYGQTGEELYSIRTKQSVRSASWSPDSCKILTSNDSSINIHTTNVEELIQIARRRASRQLTDEEKKKYGVPD